MSSVVLQEFGAVHIVEPEVNSQVYPYNGALAKDPPRLLLSQMQQLTKMDSRVLEGTRLQFDLKSAAVL
ncbi:hypothetical protein C5167_025370 [Papaver somniferum]|uniref:Uncharacterized protein n=1 Tax=Papaver somniferum TaxID=3469 RepID=A0A4Y7JUI7_PAPSO|nr:hypothetical protein C5167_025370 [Papaver somniferum]